jgi:predicted nucleotidyltransferase
MTQADLLATLAGLSGGLAGRLLHAAEDARSLEELYSLAATKKYPDATVRRALLYALLAVREEDLRAPVSYVRLLAASREGCAYLSSRRRTASIPVITRQGEIPTSVSAKRQSALETRERALYTLLLPKRATTGELLCRPPVICL